MGIVPFPHCFSLGPGINGLLPQHQLVLLYTRTEKIGRKDNSEVDPHLPESNTNLHFVSRQHKGGTVKLSLQKDSDSRASLRLISSQVQPWKSNHIVSLLEFWQLFRNQWQLRVLGIHSTSLRSTFNFTCVSKLCISNPALLMASIYFHFWK